MRISDWSSDVCSSDLGKRRPTERCEIHRFSPSSASRARSYSALANTSHDGGGGAGIAFGGPAGDVFSSTSAASCAAALDPALVSVAGIGSPRSEEHTSELQSLMRISYAVFCLKK